MKSLFFSVIFLLVSCEMPNILKGKKRNNNTTIAQDDPDITPDPIIVEAPTALTLSYPTAVSSIHTTPKISIAGVISGDTVKLYSDSTCANEIGSSTSAGTSVLIESSILAIGSYTFYAKRISSDAISSSCSTANLTYDVVACPTVHGDYIVVPGNTDYEANDFCAAKYEMKDVAGVATSQVNLAPSVSINKAAAVTECSNLGANYKLISNAQWQTIARNIELVSSNWENGVIGQGLLNTGHSDNNPSSICDASIENVTSDCSTLDTDFKQKRTHTLSNGEVIWDFSGNVDEWVIDDNSVGTQYNAANIKISALTDAAPTVTGSLDDGVNRAAKGQFGSTGDYSATLNSSPFGGLGSMDNPHIADGTNNSLYRGSSRGAGFQLSGIFSVAVTPASSSFATLGYRCVFTE